LYFQNATECTILPPSEKQFSEGRPLPLLVSRGLACMQCFLFADDFIGAMAHVHDVFFKFDKHLKSKSNRKNNTDEPETERYLSRQGKQIVPNF
jgi:hypothetical protein